MSDMTPDERWEELRTWEHYLTSRTSLRCYPASWDLTAHHCKWLQNTFTRASVSHDTSPTRPS